MSIDETIGNYVHDDPLLRDDTMSDTVSINDDIISDAPRRVEHPPLCVES